MRAVARAIRDREVLLVEAGTGTGKTLGYLIPAVLSAEQVIVSTATKTLQQQVFLKEVPFLKQRLGLVFEAAMLKGRTNYLCLYKLGAARGRTDLVRNEARWLRRLRAWAAETETGDRGELDELPDDASIWAEVSTGAEGCLGQSCEFYQECFVFRARRRAAEADIVVVNHHLFFADLALKEDLGMALLPPAPVVIFDEAHHVEDIASAFFGVSISDYRIRDLVGDVERALRAAGRLSDQAERTANSVRDRTSAFFERYKPLLPKARLKPDELPDGVETAWHALDNALEALRHRCREQAHLDPAFDRLGERCAEVREALGVLAIASDRSLVTWVESGPRATFLKAAPINIGAVLQETLFARVEALIFTSATLTTEGDFGHARRRLGITFDCPEMRVPAAFDYREQALLYVASDLPRPSSPHFLDEACGRILELVDITAGDALLLFTSFHNMRGAWERLEERLPYPSFMQGQASRDALLAELRNTPGAVLFATGSFWEGIDIVGQALSLVVIDKLPFAPPDDPLTSARIEWLKANHRNAFMEYQVPAAVISLKQGFGRLIRSRADVGIVAVLDQRLATARYGRVFLDSLPPARRVHDTWRLGAAYGQLLAAPAALPEDGCPEPNAGDEVTAGTAADAEVASEGEHPVEVDGDVVGP